MQSEHLRRWLRPDQTATRDICYDVLFLLLVSLLLIATGIGLRDPWPADEPRYALIARDMVLTGEWLIPHIAGDIYADKPPVFFWLMAAAYSLTGSMRWSFLLPSLLSAVGCVLLIYDLGRRLWDREVGLLAGTALLFTVQFVWQARQAQIDATLCFFTTLSCYGLLRHLLLGPQWRWYIAGWFAAGIGVITKGVGFLPLLLLIAFALLRRHSRVEFKSAAVWLLGPLAFLIAVSAWLLPMLMATQAQPELASYRDEILFQQTVNRYANAWHHLRPIYYYVVDVIPGLWLPLTLLIPWLVPHWRAAWRARDLRVVLPLLWVALVVLFFSLSAGKRGVYVLPALPMLVLAAAPFLRELFERRGPKRALFGLCVFLVVMLIAAALHLSFDEEHATRIETLYELKPVGPLLLMAAAIAFVCVFTRVARAPLTYALSITSVLAVVSFWVNPVMNDVRSGKYFVARVMRAADPARDLGFASFKEQYLLHIDRPVVHFGHGRWREQKQEASDAARWLSEKPQRQLVVNQGYLKACFAGAHARSLGIANRNEWFLLESGARPECVARGNPAAVRRYVPGSRRT